MSKLSVLIPARNERFLAQTVADVFAKAAGEVEVIVALDGYWPDPPLPDRDNLIVIHHGQARGMRAANNAAAAASSGDYLMKTDAHCLFGEGFDEVLKADCADDWIVIPRRKRLDAENWRVADPERLPLDYHYLNCPYTNPDYFNFSGVVWPERAAERHNRPEYDLDDTMSFQGSCWFMSRRHWDRLGGMSEEGYGPFTQEPQEIGNKTWLGGGAVKVNKRTYYAHLHKGSRYGRGYALSSRQLREGHEWSARYWTENRWPARVHDFEWLVDKFWPVPTWPADWKERFLEGQRADPVAQ